MYLCGGINFRLNSVEAAFAGTLDGHLLVVDGLHLVDRVPGVAQLHLELPLVALCRVQQGSAFLHLTAQSQGLSLRDSNL